MWVMRAWWVWRMVWGWVVRIVARIGVIAWVIGIYAWVVGVEEWIVADGPIPVVPRVARVAPPRVVEWVDIDAPAVGPR